MIKQLLKSKEEFRSDFVIESKDSDDLWLRSLNEPLIGDIYIVKDLETFIYKQQLALIQEIKKSQDEYFIKLQKEFANTPIKERKTGWDWIVRAKKDLLKELDQYEK